MKAVAVARCLAIAAVAAICLVAAGPRPGYAVPALGPAPVPYVVSTFGDDPLGSLGPHVSIGLDPGVPDSYFGWYRSVVCVTLASDRPAPIRYAWDDPSAWHWYGTPLLAPEGKHVLYVQANDGHAGPLTALQIKVDFRSPAVSRASRAKPASGPAPANVTSTSANAVVRVTATARPFAGPRVIRVYGPDRYGTCEEIAAKDFPTGSRYAIVARGDEFPDALSAASLAGIYGAPIVLTRTAAMPDVTLGVLKTLGVTHAIVVGSERAVSANVVSQLGAAGIPVERIGGVDRYETAALIARAVVARGGERGSAFIARGDLYPDSLAVSPFAFRAKRPILLVRPTSLPDVTKSALTDLGIHGAVIAGSNQAVSDGVESQIRGLSVSTSRAQGPTRYETAIAAAEYGVANHLGNFKLVGLATGENFPDALCGGAAVGSLGGVILMTPKDYLADSVKAELQLHGPELRDVQVYGSEYAVSKVTWDQLLNTVR